MLGFPPTLGPFKRVAQAVLSLMDADAPGELGACALIRL